MLTGKIFTGGGVTRKKERIKSEEIGMSMLYGYNAGGWGCGCIHFQPEYRKVNRLLGFVCSGTGTLSYFLFQTFTFPKECEYTRKLATQTSLAARCVCPFSLLPCTLSVFWIHHYFLRIPICAYFRPQLRIRLPQKFFY
jgi:hypothetical protein